MRVHHATIELRTKDRRETHDLTDRVAAAVRESGIREGLVHVASLHTTAAVTINEHEPRLMQDLLDWLHRIAPAGAGWRHDGLAATIPGEPANTDAHLAAMLLGRGHSIPVRAGAPVLGTWQRVIFVELDGPRTRRVQVTVSGT
ncbi:hypothetical protein HRbin39_01710 [bacterium HR39]|nr:hypothetical protein HRbin39_01710 [bacterium HR39]